jgi:hypothetical protein
MAHKKLRRSVLLVLLATVFLASMSANSSAPPQSSSSEDRQIGKVLSVRKVLLLGIALPSDHPTPRGFTRGHSVHISCLYVVKYQAGAVAAKGAGARCLC